MEVCHKDLTSGNLFEKTTGRAETRMSSQWFPYVQVGGGLGLILQVMAAQPEHPELTLEKLPPLNGLILHGWTSVLHSQKTKPFFKLENLSSAEEQLIRSCPSRCGCLCRLTFFLWQGSGVGRGTGPHLETKGRATGGPYCNRRACGLLLSLPCYDLWHWDACLIRKYMPCMQKLPDMVLDTEKSGIRVNFLEKISLVLFFFCFVFW